MRAKGLSKVLEDQGISPSASSKPSASQQTSVFPAYSVYSIKTLDETESNVEVINESAQSILSQFTELSLEDEPPA